MTDLEKHIITRLNAYLAKYYDLIIEPRMGMLELCILKSKHHVCWWSNSDELLFSKRSTSSIASNYILTIFEVIDLYYHQHQFTKTINSFKSNSLEEIMIKMDLFGI